MMAIVATIQIGVRRQGRLVGWEGPHVSISRQVVDAPEDLTEKQLAVAVSIGEIKRALASAEACSDEVDTLEFMVDFTESE
jgi:hypothetical protein